MNISDQAFEIIYQLVGIIGALTCIISYQCKKNRNVFLFQLSTCLIFIVQFAMKGVWSVVIANSISALRCIFFVFSKNKKVNFFATIGFGLILIASAFLLVIVFKQPIWLTILCVTASFLAAVSFYLNNGLTIRLLQFFIISPLWLINDIYNFSIGGIISEIFTMISIIISLVRFTKIGFNKNGNTQVHILRENNKGKILFKDLSLVEINKEEENINVLFKSFKKKNEKSLNDNCVIVLSNCDQDIFTEIIIDNSLNVTANKVTRNGIDIAKDAIDPNFVLVTKKDNKTNITINVVISLKDMGYNKDNHLKYNAYKELSNHDNLPVAILPCYTGTFYNYTNMFDLK